MAEDFCSLLSLSGAGVEITDMTDIYNSENKANRLFNFFARHRLSQIKDLFMRRHVKYIFFNFRSVYVMSSVPGVYHLIRSSLGIFRAKYDTSC